MEDCEKIAGAKVEKYDADAIAADPSAFKTQFTDLLKASVARWQNLIPSFPWIAPGWRAWGRNPRKERKGSHFAA